MSRDYKQLTNHSFVAIFMWLCGFSTRHSGSVMSSARSYSSTAMIGSGIQPTCPSMVNIMQIVFARGKHMLEANSTATLLYYL